MEGRVRFLGVWLCAWLLVCQVQAHYVPSKMNRTIQNLLDNYVSPHTARQVLARWALPSWTLLLLLSLEGPLMN